MNKFIRTKDGRIISYDKNANKIDLPMILNYPNQILKQAYTVDELCDGFYIDIPGRAFNPLWAYKDFASCQKAATLLEENHVKGFIKTEKGLIFVWNFSKNEVINNG